MTAVNIVSSVLNNSSPVIVPLLLTYRQTIQILQIQVPRMDINVPLPGLFLFSKVCSWCKYVRVFRSWNVS